MNFTLTLNLKPGFHIIAGIAEIARITEKLAQRSQRLYGNQTSAIRAIPAIAAITIAEIEPGSISAIVAIEIRQKILMQITFSDPSDRSDRKLKVNPVFTHHVSGANLTLVTISCIWHSRASRNNMARISGHPYRACAKSSINMASTLCLKMYEAKIINSDKMICTVPGLLATIRWDRRVYP